ncbi:MAG TPA: Fe-S cluster assembly protein SufD [Oligoflexia bacterium]|nr:Fe-S cluster assembly protein SufD [Oligoflexia bacterium]HMP48466.1 Fe-S cluster assembly protein SufD [Oligoflexia bacterium]
MSNQEDRLSVRDVCDGIIGYRSSVSTELYENALKELTSLNFPGTRDEDWRYTSLKKFTSGKLVIQEGSSARIESIDSILKSENHIVMVNGRIDRTLSGIPSGHEFFKIINSSDSLPEIFICDRFSNSSDSKNSDTRGSGVFSPDKNRAPQRSSSSRLVFPLLNDLATEEIVLITLPEGVSETLEITHVACLDENSDTGKTPIVSPRIFVHAAKGAKLSLIEHFISMGQSEYITNHVGEFILEDNSSVNHIKIQRESDKALHISNLFSEQGENSVFKNVNLTFGSILSRNEIYPRVTSSNSEAWLVGASVLGSNQQVDNFTVIDHIAPNSESHELYKGLYGDSSKGVFSGTIIVQREAQKTNAYQSNSSLLLSDVAESNSRPQLRIWADDVKCSHGATIGQLDEDSLFYLRARGIPDKEARLMLTKAYISEVITHLEFDNLISFVEGIIENKVDVLLESQL